MNDWDSQISIDDDFEGLTIWGEWQNALEDENRYLDALSDMGGFNDIDDFDEPDVSDDADFSADIFNTPDTQAEPDVSDAHLTLDDPNILDAHDFNDETLYG